jgi:hypothetical protein
VDRSTGAVGVIDVSLLLLDPACYCIVDGAIALLIHQRRCTCAAPPP